MNKLNRYIILIILAIMYGFFVGKFKIFPYYFLYEVFHKVFLSHEIKGDTLNIKDEEIIKLISLKNKKDLDSKRKFLIDFLFFEYPISKMPDKISYNWQDERYKKVKNLYKIDKLEINMDYGLNSIVYHFVPRVNNEKVVIYYQGHEGDFINGLKQISSLLANGYSVFAISMPVLGMNSKPVIMVPNIGLLKIFDHNQFQYIRPKRGHSIRYFVEPVIVVLNYLSDYKYKSVSMMGISGGGWATVMSSALDERIRFSFPVAGSYPLYLRRVSKSDWGDFEQNDYSLYSQISYLDLYILGGSGNGRAQIQIYNKFDPCCFSGDGWKTYEGLVRRTISNIGDGDFFVVEDDKNVKHEISDFSMNNIIKYMDDH